MRVLHVVQAYYPAIWRFLMADENVSERLVFWAMATRFLASTISDRTQAFMHTAGPFMPPGVENINGVMIHRFQVFNGLQTSRKIAGPRVA